MADEKNPTTNGFDDVSIKVKVVLSATKKELDEQLKPIKERYQKAPIKLAFGLNQNDTARNINAALRKMVSDGKVITPKVTLDVKIDKSKITAQLKNVVSSVTVGAKIDDTTNAKLEEFYRLVKKTNEINNRVEMLPDESVREIEECNRQLDQMGERMTALMAELSGHIDIGEFSKLDTIMSDLNSRSALLSARLEDLRAKANTRIFYDLVEEINDLNQKISTADPSKQSSQIEAWAKRLSDAEEELTNLMVTYSEFISVGNGSKVDGLTRKFETNNQLSLSKHLDELRTKIENIDAAYSDFESKTFSSDFRFEIDPEDPFYSKMESVKKTVSDAKVSISGLWDEFNRAIETGDLTSLYQKLHDVGQETKKAKEEYKAFVKEYSSTSSNKIHLQNQLRTLQSYIKGLAVGYNGSDLEDTGNGLVKQIELGIKNGGLFYKDAESSVKDFQQACREAGHETKSLTEKIGDLVSKHLTSVLLTTGTTLIIKGLQKLYSNVVKIDSAMTELKKVTNETSAGYERFVKRSATAARELGADLSSYVNAVADWSRLGYDLVDAEELARVSTLFRNVGDGISTIEDASSYMVSILNGFHIAAEDAQNVVDIINEVANNEPISASGIAEILTRSSAAMYAAGNTLEETIALGTAMNSVLQNEETTGTTMKTVSMYLRAAKTEAESAGIEIDGMAESTSKLRKEMKSLTGVDIMADAAGKEFKSTYQILKEISEVWDNLSDVTQANVTNLLGGKRNANAVTAMLENFSIAENSLKDAANSANSAIKENKEYLDSIQGKLDQLSSAFQKFSQDFLDSDLVKGVIELGTAFVDLADGAVNLAGALPTVAAAASTVLSVLQMSGKLKNGAGKVNMPFYIRCN